MPDNKKTHWKQFHNPDYIGAYAFQPGERKILTISLATQDKVVGSSGKTEECLVVRFRENEKPLIANVTNSKAIAKVAGSNFIEDWPGTHIELFVTEVQAFGDTVEAVRVKPTAPKTGKPELTPDSPAWSDAVKYVAGGTTREQIESKYNLTDENWKKLKETNGVS